MKCIFIDPSINCDDFYEAYKHRDKADWDKLYANYDAAVDFSAATFYADLFKKYPDAKVLLTVRSADSWYNSVKNTIFRIVQELPTPEPGSVQFSINRICNAICLDGQLFDPESFSQEEKIKQLYLDHIESVKRTIPPDQLLVVELGEGWERICKFLEKDVPSVPYPRANSTEEFIDFFVNGNRPDKIVPKSSHIKSAAN